MLLEQARQAFSPGGQNGERGAKDSALAAVYALHQLGDEEAIHCAAVVRDREAGPV